MVHGCHFPVLKDLAQPVKGGQPERVMTRFVRSKNLSVYVLDRGREKARSDGKLLLAFEAIAAV